MLRVLLYIFGGLFMAYGLFRILYMTYWGGILHGSVEPEANKLVVGTMGQEIGEASVSLFMGLVLLSLQRIIALLSE